MEPESHRDTDAARELEAALGDLRREIRERFRRPPNDPGAGITGEWERAFTGLRRWFSTLGMLERSAEVDEFGMDPAALRRAQPALDLLYDRYWRVDLKGLEHLPPEGPCLLVANRSGLLPYDGLMLCHGVQRARPKEPRPRFTIADWLIEMPFAQSFFARLGGVRACRENAERLLRAGRVVAVFPEGAKGAVKLFKDRYRIQRFGRGGALRVALDARVPLLPVGIVGGEEVHPILFKPAGAARALGLRCLPITPTFPLLGPLGLLPLPSKWRIRIGEPIDLQQLAAAGADDDLLVSRLTEDLRERVQNLVEVALSERSSVWS